VWPFYQGTIQYIDFSDNLRYMYQRLINARQFLYEKVELENGMVDWKMIHRFINGPNDLMFDFRTPFVFSPDFTMYLDVDRRTHHFIIRDTFTENIIY
jgi:hypothetical protein